MLLPSWTVTNAVNFLPAVFDVTARNTTRSSTSTYMTCTAQMNDRTKGLLIILAGVLCVSPDAVLVRFLSEGGADPWYVLYILKHARDISLVSYPTACHLRSPGLSTDIIA